MDSSILSKVAVRLPNFITLFFSITLVTGFRLLGDHFHWSSTANFNFETWNDTLVMGNFIATLFFIVTAWIGFCVLTERNQYTLSFSRFFFDVFRFALMFALLNWSFLSERPGRYYIFIFGLAGYHILMVIWYLFTINVQHKQNVFDFKQDLAPHLLPFIVYVGLGIYYLYAVLPSSAPDALLPANHVAVVVIMISLIVVWCVWRLKILKNRLIAESLKVAQ